MFNFRLFIDKQAEKIDKKKLFALIFIIYLLGISIFFYNDISRSRESILANVDTKLRNGAIAVNYIVPKELVDSGYKKLPLSSQEEKSNSLELSKLANELGLKYIYSFIMLDDTVYFVSSSSNNEEIKNDDVYVYLNEYKEATKELKNLFKKENGELIEVSTDQWGYFRSVLKSFKSPQGNIYVTGADIEIKSIKMLYLISFLKSLLVAVVLLLIILPIIFLYEKINNLEKTNNKNIKILEKLEIDEVTGLPYIERLWSETDKLESPSIFLLGLNNLKVINFHYGDKIGDEILKHISNLLIQIQGESLCGKVYKVGFDEFAVVLNGEWSQEEIYLIAQNVMETIYNNPFVNNEESIVLTLVMGVASFDKNESSEIQDNLGKLKKVFLEARIALNYSYEKKLRIFIFNSCEINSLSSASSEIFWTRKISEALKEDRISSYFQPILNIENGKIEKYESLIRMNTLDNRVLTPYYFLDISHKVGLYFKLTEAVISNTFDYFSDKDIEFSINISVKDILDEATKRLIVYETKQFHNPKLIVFEILESEEIVNFLEIAEFIETIRNLGCKIAIDDFGSGYSNFERLSTIDIDYIKIDGSLIKNIDVNKNHEILVQMIVAMSKTMNIKTIAEFVHSESIYKKVKELGIDYAQGYYIGEPKPILVPDPDFLPK